VNNQKGKENQRVRGKQRAFTQGRRMPKNQADSQKGVHSMKLRPLNDRIIVKRLDEEEKTKGGIIIPDSAKEKPIQGKVMAVGKGKLKEDGTRSPMDIKVGDVVLFGKYGGTDVKHKEEEYLILREEDVLAIVE
jgi:chaperonin GroES